MKMPLATQTLLLAIAFNCAHAFGATSTKEKWWSQCPGPDCPAAQVDRDPDSTGPGGSSSSKNAINKKSTAGDKSFKVPNRQVEKR